MVRGSVMSMQKICSIFKKVLSEEGFKLVRTINIVPQKMTEDMFQLKMEHSNKSGTKVRAILVTVTKE